ncbi:MAG: aldehyde dehydrogenase family protein, partial [Candidatus Dormibacteria bacterium]
MDTKQALDDLPGGQSLIEMSETLAGAVPLDHFISGRSTPGRSDRTGPVYNPATGEVVARVPLASADEVDLAVASARAAQPAWAGASISRRTEVLFSFRHLLHTHREELAELVSREHGKVLSDALGEVARGIENVEFACGLGQLLKGGHT